MKPTANKIEEIEYDINDIATDEEAFKKECNCIIHSGGHKPMSGFQDFEIWSDWNESITERKK